MAAVPRVDAVNDLRKVLRDHLTKDDDTKILRVDESIGASVPWRPHLLDESSGVAWHVLAEAVSSNSWITRMEKARTERPDLRIGVALPEELLHKDDELLIQLNGLNSRIALLPALDTGGAGKVRLSNSIADVIYENGFCLSQTTADKVLRHLFQRCYEAPDNNTKGVTLEIVTAVMLSQVNGFDVTHRGISNRSQQIDVRVHNRNVGGVLGGSPLIIAEAKNWNYSPGAAEYAVLHRKMSTRHGLCRLGYFVTTDRYTRGVHDEGLRDSTEDILIVPLDKQSLPSIWEGATENDSITRRLEQTTIDAASQ
jgi:hypothetical protein